MKLDELIEKTFSLSDRVCPKDHGDQPCIYCLECPRANLQEFNSASFEVRKTVNSAEIVFTASVRDDFDLVLMRILESNLENFPWVLEHEPPTEIKMFVGLTDVRRSERRKKIRGFLKELPLLGKVFTRGRSALKKWANEEVQRLKERINP